MGNVSSIRGQRKPRKPLKHARRKDVAENKFEGLNGPIETQHMLISALLPQNVKAFLAQCEREVDELCGQRYRHSTERNNHRWGSSQGSIILANQRVAVEVPRVREKDGAYFGQGDRVFRLDGDRMIRSMPNGPSERSDAVFG